jgi:hypothetical protein
MQITWNEVVDGLRPSSIAATVASTDAMLAEVRRSVRESGDVASNAYIGRLDATNFGARRNNPDRKLIIAAVLLCMRACRAHPLPPR